MELNPQQQACDDTLIIDRWCGYGGHFVKANKNLFLKHLHECELERCIKYYGPEKNK